MTTAKKIKEGCGKDFTLEREDYECGGEIETDKFESGCGFLLCPTCQARLEGFQAGENSKHKSDLQQELERLEDDIARLKIIIANDKTPKYPYDKSEQAQNNYGQLPEKGKRFLMPEELARNLIKEKEERINFIKKELENLENG
jgi:uncharacterized Zn finger protein (UPF0148 family)